MIALPAPAQHILASVLGKIEPGPLYVGTSGNATVERLAWSLGWRNIWGNDVSLYSCALGAVLTGETLPVNAVTTTVAGCPAILAPVDASDDSHHTIVSTSTRRRFFGATTPANAPPGSPTTSESAWNLFAVCCGPTADVESPVGRRPDRHPSPGMVTGNDRGAAMTAVTTAGPSHPADPELELMRVLQLHLDRFGPKTAAQVAEAIEGVILATRGLDEAAVTRALAWGIARTDDRRAEAEAKEGKKTRSTPEPEPEQMAVPEQIRERIEANNEDPSRLVKHEREADLSSPIGEEPF